MKASPLIPIALFAQVALLVTATAQDDKAPWNRPLAAPQGDASFAEARREAAGELSPVDDKALEVIPAAHADEKIVCLTLEKCTANEPAQGQELTLRLINGSGKPVVFTGFSEQSPIVRIQKRVDGKWVDQERLLRCGTGLRPCTVPAGKSVVFQVHVQTEWMPLRVGVEYSSGEADAQRVTAWSEQAARPVADVPIRLIDKR